MKTKWLFLVALGLAVPVLAQLNVRVFETQNDMAINGEQDEDIEWYQGEYVQYDIFVRRGRQRVNIPTNAVPIWRVWTPPDTTNMIVSSTGTVVSASAGHVRFNLTPAQSNAATGTTHQSMAEVSIGSTNLGVIASSKAIIRYNPDATNVSYVGTVAINDYVLKVGDAMTGGLTNTTAAGFTGNGANLTNLANVVLYAGTNIVLASTNQKYVVNSTAAGGGDSITVTNGAATDPDFASSTTIAPSYTAGATQIQWAVQSASISTSHIVAAEFDGRFVNLSGDTMTGNLTMPDTGWAGFLNGPQVQFDDGNEHLNLIAGTVRARSLSPTADDTWYLGTNGIVWTETHSAAFIGDGDPADAGVVRLPNAGLVAWEASPAGTDVSIQANASEEFEITAAGGITLGAAQISEAELEILDGALITTAELTTLEDGSNADSLHVHAAAGISSLDHGADHTSASLADDDHTHYVLEASGAATNLTLNGTTTLNDTLNATNSTIAVSNIVTRELRSETGQNLDLIPVTANSDTIWDSTWGNIDLGSNPVSNFVAATDVLMGANAITNSGSIFIAEQAAGDTDTAGQGQLWVSNAAPNKLYFTDDTGVDNLLGGAADNLGNHTATADLKMAGNAITNSGPLFIAEQADADTDTAAQGQIWVDLATPNVLYFTDDAGTDFRVSFSTEAQLEAILGAINLIRATEIDTAAELAAIMTDESGSAGGFTRQTSPAFTTPTFTTSIAQSGDSGDAGAVRLQNGAAGAITFEASPAGADGNITFNSAEVLSFTSITGLQVEDDDWFGIAATTARVEFDDAATDLIELLVANVRVGDGTPGVATGLESLYVESHIETDGDVDVAGNIVVAGTVDGKDIATNAGMLDENEAVTGMWTFDAAATSPVALSNTVSGTLTFAAGDMNRMYFVTATGLTGTLPVVSGLTQGDWFGVQTEAVDLTVDINANSANRLKVKGNSALLDDAVTSGASTNASIVWVYPGSGTNWYCVSKDDGGGSGWQ